MTRINTNVASLQAQRALTRNNDDLNTRLQRLSTGLKINTGKDGPAALIASENLRGEIAGIRQAIDNTSRASNVLDTAEGSLAEVSSLLQEMQGLVNQSANTGAFSPEEIEANQLQLDTILASVDRISNTTQFNGRRLLNGELDYQVDGVTAGEVMDAQVFSAKLADGGPLTVNVQVAAAAEQALITGPTAALADAATIRVGGNEGVQQISFASGATVADMADAINQYTNSTGVEAVDNGGTLEVRSTGYGANQYATAEVVTEGTPGTFTVSASKSVGVDAEVSINGALVDADGLSVNARTGNLDVSLTLDAAFAGDATATFPLTTSFDVTGGGARFQIGSTVQSQGQVDLGLGSVTTSKLGNNAVGFLSSPGQRRRGVAGRRPRRGRPADPHRRHRGGRHAPRPARGDAEERVRDEHHQPAGGDGERDQRREHDPRRRLRRRDRRPDAGPDPEPGQHDGAGPGQQQPPAGAGAAAGLGRQNDRPSRGGRPSTGAAAVLVR